VTTCPDAGAEAADRDFLREEATRCLGLSCARLQNLSAVARDRSPRHSGGIEILCLSNAEPAEP